MTRRRWIADEFSQDRAALTGAHAAHLSRTLRARVGEEFEVACGEQVRRATVSSVSEQRVEFSLGEEISTREAVPITLWLAIFKFDRMEWAIEKCTELNATMIVPLIARRTEKHLALSAAKRVDRWRRIAREAAEQSRRTSFPEIHEPVSLKEALARYPSTNAVSPRGGICGSSFGSLSIVLSETERAVSLLELLRSRDDLSSLTLAIGPEGGWTWEELQLFTSAGWLTTSLGDTILRAETAAIAALAIARAEFWG